MSQCEFGFTGDFPEPSHHLEPDFLRFHRERPEIYAILVSETRKMVAEGCTQTGIGHLWERCRRELRCGELNNNHRAFYARMITENEPDLKGIFQLREQKGARP